MVIHVLNIFNSKSISAAERLCVTIHFLAYGSSHQSLSYSYRNGNSTISGIINKTCLAIWIGLQEQYLRPPNTPDVDKTAIDSGRPPELFAILCDLCVFTFQHISILSDAGLCDGAIDKGCVLCVFTFQHMSILSDADLCDGAMDKGCP